MDYSLSMMYRLTWFRPVCVCVCGSATTAATNGLTISVSSTPTSLLCSTNIPTHFLFCSQLDAADALFALQVPFLLPAPLPPCHSIILFLQ
jgi:hypothetical protein